MDRFQLFPAIEAWSARDLGAVQSDVRSIRAHNLTDDDLALLSTFEHIELLDLVGSNEVTDLGLEAVAHVTSLKILDLTFCERITHRGVKSIAALPRLHTIIADWCYGLDNSAMAALASCVTLDTLSLLGCERVGDDGLETLAQSVQLTNLQLPEFADISDRGIVALGENASRLRSLGCTKLDHVTDVGWSRIAQAPVIEDVKVVSCRNISDRTIHAFGDAHMLRSLTIAGCPAITASGVEILRSRRPLLILNYEP